MSYTIPQEVQDIAAVLEKQGYKTYLVGGCVRDLLLKKKPKDWDIATDAKPEKLQQLFPEHVYENEFGTVAVKTESDEKSLKVIEVTTFRIEGKYTDKRHPDNITFAKTIEEDLSRRDFTVNAVALNLKPETHSPAGGLKPELIDPHNGQKDLKDKIIRTVGDSEKHFTEDALRLMRAVRLAIELGFTIEKETAEAVKAHAGLLEVIAKERVRDELVKTIMTSHASDGIRLLEELKLLKHIIPELREGIDCMQNKHHIYTVWEHSIKSLDYAAKKEYSLIIRLASLLHDVGKPRTKRGEGYNATFYNHEIVGAKMTIQILDRLHFSKKIIEQITHLVRYHLFYYNVGEVTEAGVRRFLSRVGPENVDNLIKIREADRIGSGVPKAVPYKIRHLLFMIEKVKQDPISHKMLAVTGDDVIRVANIEPGPKIGKILAVLLDEVIDDPKKNTKKNLEKRVKELVKFSDEELVKLARKAQERKEEFEKGIEKEIKRKYYVK